MASLGTSLKMSTAFHPCTDGQSERNNQTMEQLVRAFVDAKQSNWVQLLSQCEFAYNSSIHASTCASPFYLQYGIESRAPVDAVLDRNGPASSADSGHAEHQAALQLAQRSLHIAQVRQAAQVNKRRRDVHLKAGQLVLLSSKNLSWPASVTKKFVPKFLGPFKVLEVIGAVNYKLDLPATLPVHPVFHISLLKPWVESDQELFPSPRDNLDHPAPVDRDDNQYEVEAIIAGPRVRGKPSASGQPTCVVQNQVAGVWTRT
jgi:hypothetical protein